MVLSPRGTARPPPARALVALDLLLRLPHSHLRNPKRLILLRPWHALLGSSQPSRAWLTGQTSPMSQPLGSAPTPSQQGLLSYYGPVRPRAPRRYSPPPGSSRPVGSLSPLRATRPWPGFAGSAPAFSRSMQEPPPEPGLCSMRATVNPLRPVRQVQSVPTDAARLPFNFPVRCLPNDLGSITNDLQQVRNLLVWSGCRDLNPGPPAPKAGALPSCATSRLPAVAYRLNGLARRVDHAVHAGAP
jgi:hypothetical protein